MLIFDHLESYTCSLALCFLVGDLDLYSEVYFLSLLFPVFTSHV